MAQLVDVTIDPKVKLCALWVSIVFCLIFSEHFSLFTPGSFEASRSLRADPESRDIVTGTFLMLASPILMIYLSIALPTTYNRILNIVVGLSFILLWAGLLEVTSRIASEVNVTLHPSAPRVLSIAIAAFAALVVWHAWKWPSTPSSV